MQEVSYATTRSLIKDKPVCFDSLVSNGAVTLFEIPDVNHNRVQGGLRLNGFYKKQSDKLPLISVVTVVFNGVGFLESTIKSVIEQNYDNVEYIIVDGGSTDGTLDVIRKYEHAIDYWVSEPDKGIYDAMNKAIDLATGQWINFMNAGDFFYKNNTLMNVFVEFKIPSGAKVVFGNHQVIYPDKIKKIKAGKIKNIWKGGLFCHQSSFVELKYHKYNKFNICRKIAADYEFFYNAWMKDLAFVFNDRTLSRVISGGVSDLKRVDSILECWAVVDKTGFRNLFFIGIILKEIVKGGIKKVFFYV